MSRLRATRILFSLDRLLFATLELGKTRQPNGDVVQADGTLPRLKVLTHCAVLLAELGPKCLRERRILQDARQRPAGLRSAVIGGDLAAMLQRCPAYLAGPVCDGV